MTWNWEELSTVWQPNPMVWVPHKCSYSKTAATTTILWTSQQPVEITQGNDRWMTAQEKRTFIPFSCLRALGCQWAFSSMRWLFCFQFWLFTTERRISMLTWVEYRRYFLDSWGGNHFVSSHGLPPFHSFSALLLGKGHWAETLSSRQCTRMENVESFILWLQA